MSPRVGLVGDRARAEPADDRGGRGRVVGDHDDLGDRRAGEGGGDRVGQQGEDEGVVAGRPSPRRSAGRSRVLATASRFAGTTTDQVLHGSM